MHKYQMTIESTAACTSYAVAVDVAGQGWTELVSWDAPPLERGWRTQVDAEASTCGWSIGPDTEWPGRRPAKFAVDVVPQDWVSVLGQATDEYRRLQAAAHRHERAWHGLIADVPKAEISVTDVSKIVGLGRVWVTRIRSDNQQASNKD